MHHHEAGDHGLPGEVDDGRAGGDGHLSPRSPIAAMLPSRMMSVWSLRAGRAGAVDDPDVGQRDDRRVDLDVGRADLLRQLLSERRGREQDRRRDSEKYAVLSHAQL